jgi:hypothetical protein
VWVQLSDGSCRWRQSAGEVEVQALRVPAGLAAGQLRVELQLYSILGELMSWLLWLPSRQCPGHGRGGLHAM